MSEVTFKVKIMDKAVKDPFDYVGTIWSPGGNQALMLCQVNNGEFKLIDLASGNRESDDMDVISLINDETRYVRVYGYSLTLTDG